MPDAQPAHRVPPRSVGRSSVRSADLER
jgi:hypothetical protein